MRTRILLLLFCLYPAEVFGQGIESAYSHFDLEKNCREMAHDPEEGSFKVWACPGHAGNTVLQAVDDDRSFVGFGAKARESCAFRTTFTNFNTALSPIEWRLKDGQPFAVIERWRVSTDDMGGSATWLVVSKFTPDEACPVHFVAGAFPKANEEARRAADTLVPAFDCSTGTPTVSTKANPPPIALKACGPSSAE